MDKNALTPSPCIDPHEQTLREQLYEGFRLSRALDEQVRSIPPGQLSSPTTTQLRCSIAVATADVVAAFNKSIKLLLHNSDCTWDYSSALSAATPQKAAINLVAAEQIKSPPHSPAAGRHVKASSAAAHCKQQSNMACASPTPSSPRMIHSPLLSATSEMSDGSPKPNQLDLPADEATTANPTKAPICGKRKLQPKVALKMPAGNAETAESNIPPDDGHTWRKYGQKNILGAQYPRSYYRCTHKTDTGCTALKLVQRCDEDDSFFDVVYKGYHTCRSAELDKECWPLAFPQGLLHFPNRSGATLLPPAAASLMLSAAAQQTNTASHRASLDNLLCHVVSVASSDGLMRYPDLSVNQASSSVMNPPPLPYQFNMSEQALLNRSPGPGRGSDHVHPLFRNSSAAIQDESTTKEQLRGGGASSCQLYAEEQRRAINPLEDWTGFENNNGEMYKSQLGYVVVDQNARIDPERQQLLPSNCSSLHKQDDVASSALAFDALDNDDDLLVYLDP